MSVDEHFDKVLKREMTPEELYAVIVDDVKAIYADGEEIKTDERGRIIRLTDRYNNKRMEW